MSIQEKIDQELKGRFGKATHHWRGKVVGKESKRETSKMNHKICLFGKIRGSENQKKRKERKGKKKERKEKERKKKGGQIPGFKNTRKKDTTKSACLGKQMGEV